MNLSNFKDHRHPILVKKTSTYDVYESAGLLAAVSNVTSADRLTLTFWSGSDSLTALVTKEVDEVSDLDVIWQIDASFDSWREDLLSGKLYGIFEAENPKDLIEKLDVVHTMFITGGKNDERRT